MEVATNKISAINATSFQDRMKNSHVAPMGAPERSSPSAFGFLSGIGITYQILVVLMQDTGDQVEV